MTREKKAIDADFHRAVTNTIGRQSAVAVAAAAGLTKHAIQRALEGVNPLLTGAIEIASALGFEIRYEWPRGADAHRHATRLAVHMHAAMRPEFRELTDHPQIWAFAEAFIATRDDMARELGPSRTGDPDKTFDALLRVIEMQKKMRPATDGLSPSTRRSRSRSPAPRAARPPRSS